MSTDETISKNNHIEQSSRNVSGSLSAISGGNGLRPELPSSGLISVGLMRI
jgi:hypothetical protein